jgi:deoxycytidylate deaminase
LESTDAGSAFDVTILKAREEILAWGLANGREMPASPKSMDYAHALQDLGDAMRKDTGDFAAVARSLIRAIRTTRARKTNANPESNDALTIHPDRQPRAYILDSIRHPFEVQLLSHIYQDAFILVGVVCDETERENRLTRDKFTEAGIDRVRKFMRRDAKDKPKYGQRVSEAFHLAHYFLDNTEARRIDGKPNPEWRLVEQLTRLKKILTHHEVVRPNFSEIAMFAAQGAKLRSACLSRQVGAAIADSNGNVVALGTNEVPQAGGGVYGGSDSDDNHMPNDDRCVHRPDKFCSNTKEQLRIIDEVMNNLVSSNTIKDDMHQTVKAILEQSPIGSLLEFSRAVHAEMEALLSLARRGLSAVGTRVFVTTFPCHYCARHIVAAGVDEVQYIEPYPKSKALELHKDSIVIRSAGWKPPSKDGTHVLFRPFVGVAPRLYSRVFTKVRELKNDQGDYHVSKPEWAEPVHLGRMSYIELEKRLVES